MKKNVLKLMIVVMAVVLSVGMCIGLSACGNKNLIGVTGQVPALQEVAMGTSDVAFVDYTLAASQCGKGSFANLQIVKGIELSKEEFAIGIRKEDTALATNINNALVKLYKSGKMEELRIQFGSDSIATCDLSSKTEGDIDSKLGAGKTLTIGVTDYAPMDYKDKETKQWTGFDAEMARLVAAELGYDNVKFEEIDWDQKITELKSKKIDLIWNGMTVTDELAKEMAFSYSYATNYQVAVIDKANAEKYTSLESMKGAKIAFESGSAGETAVKDYFGK